MKINKHKFNKFKKPLRLGTWGGRRSAGDGLPGASGAGGGRLVGGGVPGAWSGAGGAPARGAGGERGGGEAEKEVKG
jgi:hypothetical protein